MKIVGLFAGIGGLESGLDKAGHSTVLLCENEPGAMAVLKHHFPGIPLHDDVRTLQRIPTDTTLITAGFPCQDLSQAGKTVGIAGSRSGLVGEVFRLIRKAQTPWVLLENVPFMLQLAGGKAMDVITSTFEDLGYKWAYRVVDSRAFGLPQRRRRVYFLASRVGDPREVLFADDTAGGDTIPSLTKDVAFGFYWTEGSRGLGGAVDGIPTLKGGSALGIPSSPAILLPQGDVVTPNICDAERLQGFPADWTKPAETVGRPSHRWKLVGNAVSVPAAEWIGQRLQNPGTILNLPTTSLDSKRWPGAAYNTDGKRMSIGISEWPTQKTRPSIADFLKYPSANLSFRATNGFLSRASKSSLRFPPGFIDALNKHADRMAKVTRKTVENPKRAVRS